MKSGECTYLAAGEIAIDTGQAKNSFYYPGGEYLGYEVIVYMGEETEFSEEVLPASINTLKGKLAHGFELQEDSLQDFTILLSIMRKKKLEMN